MHQIPTFEWDEEKDFANQEKHGVSFGLAQYAFADPNRVILKDLTHSTENEERFYCLGKVDQGILTFYISKWSNTDFWRRVLAKRKADL